MSKNRRQLDRRDVSRRVDAMHRARYEVTRRTGLLDEIEKCTAALGECAPLAFREVFSTLYAGAELSEVETENEREWAFASTLHRLLDESGELDKLRASTAGSGALASVATRRLVQGLIDRHQFPELAEDATDEDRADELAEWAEWLNDDEERRAELLKALAQPMSEAIAESSELSEALRGLMPGRSPAELELDPSAQTAILASRDLLSRESVRAMLDALGAMRELMSTAERRLESEGVTPSGVVQTNELRRLLPTERMALVSSESSRRLDALRRFADGSTLGYETREHVDADRGPFTVLLDRSGSMEGASWLQARAFALAALQRAHEHGREFRLVTFTTTAVEVAIDLSSVEATLKSIERVSALNANGGTDFTVALNQALRATGDEGDVLMVTDGMATVPSIDLRDVRLSVLGIGVDVRAHFAKLTDRTWQVRDLLAPEALRAAVLASDV